MSDKAEFCILAHIHVNGTKEAATALADGIGESVAKINGLFGIEVMSVSILIGVASNKDEKKGTQNWMEDALQNLGNSDEKRKQMPPLVNDD